MKNLTKSQIISLYTDCQNRESLLRREVDDLREMLAQQQLQATLILEVIKTITTKVDCTTLIDRVPIQIGPAPVCTQVIHRGHEITATWRI